MSLNIDFPKLSIKQVALIRAECNTGIILDENFRRHISAQQTFYSVFETYENALKYIKSISMKDVEFTIYNQNRQILLYHNPGT